MYLRTAFSALISIWQPFSRDLSPLHPPVSGESAHELDVVGEGKALCPLIPWQLDFDLPTWQHPASSSAQSNCSWTDNHEQQYCVFADPHFNDGQGITVITTRERARHIFQSITSTSRRPSSPEPLFTTRHSGIKGRGIFATQHIHAGRLITQESPIIFVDRNLLAAVSSEEDRTPLEAFAIKKLPRIARQIFHELYPGLHGDSLEQRMWTNGYGVSGGPGPEWPGLESESDLGMVAVHANISVSVRRYMDDHIIASCLTSQQKINHSCRANAAAQWDWGSLAHKLWAARDIAAGEEITITYLDPIQNRRERQEFANNTLAFECACSHCNAPRELAELSDDRISEILLLEQSLENRQIAPAEPVAMAELLVSLYKEEDLYTNICKAYAIAALESNGAGHEYQARSWAYQSVKAGMIAGSGAGMEEYVEDMEALLNGARKHWSWKYRVH